MVPNYWQDGSMRQAALRPAGKKLGALHIAECCQCFTYLLREWEGVETG